MRRCVLSSDNIEEGRANGHALTFCSVLGAEPRAQSLFLAGDFDAAERYGDVLFKHAERHAIRLWRLWAGCFKGIDHGQTRRHRALGWLSCAVKSIARATPGSCRAFSLPLGELAACLGEASEDRKGLTAVDETLGRCEARQEQWYVPELLRIRGELMLKDTQHQSASSARKMLLEALRLAKHQGALFWELRSAVSLARLWVGQDRKSDASQILAPACGAFAKGLQIADVREAKALLDGFGADQAARHQSVRRKWTSSLASVVSACAPGPPA